MTPPDKAQWWTILVSGYGHFLFQGTEIEAEEKRRHKARWEQGMARKRPASKDEIQLQKSIPTDEEREFFRDWEI